jgi:hypothetical protein
LFVRRLRAHVFERRRHDDEGPDERPLPECAVAEGLFPMISISAAPTAAAVVVAPHTSGRTSRVRFDLPFRARSDWRPKTS